MKTMTRTRSMCGVAFALLTSMCTVHADSVIFVTTINRTLVVGSDLFGGCMAATSVDPSTLLPGCARNWVTFSCTGDFGDQVQAYRMLDQAQLALATDKNVMLEVRDSQKHNGYCYAARIDVIR